MRKAQIYNNDSYPGIAKYFIHLYTNDEIPMEFVMKFDKVLQELVKVFEEPEFYTDAEIFAEKYSDFDMGRKEFLVNGTDGA